MCDRIECVCVCDKSRVKVDTSSICTALAHDAMAVDIRKLNVSGGEP